MRKCLSLLLVMLLLAGAALAEGLTPVNKVITIDGVRTAFFAPDGAYLQPMEKEGLLYVPVLSLGENLGLEVTADSDTLAVTIGGIRAAFFSEDGAYLPPVAVDGVVYVSLTAFAETAGIDLSQEENTYELWRKGAASQVTPDPTAAPTPQPVYGYVPVTEANFLDFFTVETGTSYPDINANISPFKVTYKLTCRATTSYGLENVKFKVNKFGTVTMPASGTVTKTVQDSISRWDYKSDVDYIRGQGAFCTGAVLQSFSLEGASGRLRMSYDEAEALKKDYYEKAKGYFELGAYSNAVRWYELLAGIDYLDSKELLKEARSKKAAEDRAAAEAAAKKKEEENQKKYAAAQAAFDNGDWDAAIKGFKALGDYEDSKAKVTAATENKSAQAYKEALALEKDGQYEEAIAAFEALKDYKDSAQHLAACRTAKADKEKRAAYEAAEKLEADGDYVGAYDAFIKIANFEDSAQRAEKLLLSKTCQQAETLMAERKFADAIELLTPYQENPQIREMINICNLRGAALLSPFTAEGWAFFVKNGYHFIDLQGNVKPLPAGEIVKYNNEFVQDGMILMKTNGSYYFVNLNGETVGETYKEARHFNQGRAVVTTKDGKPCLIDKQGQVVSTLPAKKGRTYGYYMGSDLVSFTEKKETGLMNLKGKVIVKAGKYKGILYFADGLAEVYAAKDKTGKLIRGVINEKGKEVLKLGKFDVEEVLGKDLIVVKENKRYGIVNEKGKSLLPAEYKNVIRVGDLILADKNGKRGAYDLTLNPIIPHEYETIAVGYQSQVVALKKDGIYKLYNLKDLTQPLIEGNGTGVKMDRESPYIAWYEQDLGWFIYDHEGNLIF